MPDISLTVRAEIICAIKLFAGGADASEYLNAIALEIGPSEFRVIATNEAVLGVFRVPSEQVGLASVLPDKVILSLHLLRHIKPKGDVEIVIGERDTSGSYARPVSIAYCGLVVSGVSLNYEYPRYRSAIPHKVSGEPAQFDLRLLDRIVKAYAALHGPKAKQLIGIGYNGDAGGALFHLDDPDFVGVIMPFRKGSAHAWDRCPDWVADTTLAHD